MTENKTRKISTAEFFAKYKHPRWQKKRLERMEQAGWRCENCESDDKTLHVHHKSYKKNHAPWEYENDELECLCEDCHAEKHGIQEHSENTQPNSIFAEQSVLGALIINNSMWEKISSKLSEADFYLNSHKLIFRTIIKLVEQQIPFDIVTLSESLKSAGNLENIGGLSYLIVIVKCTPSVANVADYAHIVYENSVRRQLIRVASEISRAAFEDNGNTALQLLEKSEQLLFNISDLNRQTEDSGLISVRQAAKKTIEKIEAAAETGEGITGNSTGYDDLDYLTSGLQPTDLIVLAGRPSMGKTCLAVNIAENIAIKEQKPIAIFSLEMSGDAIVTRMLSSLGSIEQQRVRSGDLDDNDWPRLTMALKMLISTKIFIDDSATLTVNEIRTRAKKTAREHGQLGLVIVDYIQLIKSESNNPNRVQQLSEISRGLKALAKELNVPVIALSQLNRNLEARANKRPVMSDLRDSGAIEEDADLILFIYRDEVYNENSPDKGTAELIIGKHRNGMLGTVRLMFQGQYARFQNCANPSHYSSYSNEE